MSKYFTSGIIVYNFDDCIAALRRRNEDQIKQIEYLEKENKELRNNHYKDAELQRVNSDLKKMRNDYNRGFPISEEEQKLINKWKEKHETEIHKVATADHKSKIATHGSYSYHFVPTSIGTSGTIRCSCGAEFEFCKLI